MSSFADGMAINPYAGLDEDTARAILDIQIEDLAEAEATAQRAPGTSKDRDVEVSASLFRQHLEAVRSSFSDRRMAKSIADAVISDGRLVTTNVQEEEIAGRDHERAQHLQDGTEPQPHVLAPTCAQVDDDTLSRLAGLFISERSGRSFLPTPTLMQETVRFNRTSGPKVKRHQCIACSDSKSYFEVFKAPCGDVYCRDCLRQLFETSYTDESLFPPRCCRQKIPVDGDYINLFLTKELRDRYEPRRVEVETTDRTYCSNKDCATFIPPGETSNTTAECPKCHVNTCSGCKRASHVGICAEDRAEQETLELAREEGWQRCTGCRRMVELVRGCNHITCHCKAEFCYVCGERWKTCGCLQWDEERLLARANAVVGRQNRGRPAALEVNLAQVRRTVQTLIERHECDHRGSWTRVNGAARCETSNGRLHEFILQCDRCDVQMCARCKNNRM